MNASHWSTHQLPRAILVAIVLTALLATVMRPTRQVQAQGDVAEPTVYAEPAAAGLEDPAAAHGATPEGTGIVIPVRISDALGGGILYGRLVDGKLINGDMILADAGEPWTIVDAAGTAVGTLDAADLVAAGTLDSAALLDPALSAPAAEGADSLLDPTFSAPTAEGTDSLAHPGILDLGKFVPDGVAVGSGQTWPLVSGVYRVPFFVDSAFPSDQKTAIAHAIDHWNHRTPLKFVPRTDADLRAKVYVDFKFTPGSCCFSGIGRSRNSPTTIALDTSNTDAIIHEIGHAVGFYHEHQRADRDSFVTIVWDKIFSDKRGDYAKISGGLNNIGPYNYESVMHYSELEWSFEPSIIRKDGQPLVTQRRTLSGGDIYATMTRYPGVDAGFAYGGATLSSSHSYKCMDVAFSGRADGTNIRQWSCNDSAAQRFLFRAMPSGSSTYEIVNMRTGKCVDVAYSGTANGTNVWQWSCNNTNAQRFRLASLGSGLYEIRSVLSNRCLDVDSYGGTADGANLQIWDCHGGAWQRFYISTLGTP